MAAVNKRRVSLRGISQLATKLCARAYCGSNLLLLQLNFTSMPRGYECVRSSSIDREASGSSGCQGSSLPQSIGVPMIQWLSSGCQGSSLPLSIAAATTVSHAPHYVILRQPISVEIESQLSANQSRAVSRVRIEVAMRCFYY